MALIALIARWAAEIQAMLLHSGKLRIAAIESFFRNVELQPCLPGAQE
jgi:hypothetical protein